MYFVFYQSFVDDFNGYFYYVVFVIYIDYYFYVFNERYVWSN